jgi:DNA-binding CsgD family transcriptional regulator
MPRLTHSDLRAALRFLAACDAGSGLHAFARSVTAALPAVIPCDLAVFGLVNTRAQTLAAVENPRLTTEADLATFMRVSRQSPNPPLDHFARTGDPEARLISDFVTRRQFHALPVYTDFYRPLRVEFLLGAFIHDSPTAFDGITLSRTRPDFRERDRAVLTVLRPHIIQGYRTAMAVDRLRADLVLATNSREPPGFGLVVLSGNARMRFVSPGVIALLARYFDAHRHADELPDSLARWVRQQVDAIRDASRLPAPQPPFVVERNGGRLIARFLSVARDTWLLLEEPETRAECRRLASLGVSSREARHLCDALWEEEVDPGEPRLREIARRVISLYRDVPCPAQGAAHLTPHEERLLRLLTQGHSYKTAAAAVGSSVHTVAFHMKHIYAKLQVHSKSEAVAKALRDRIVE